jgi:hypothetical protein
MARLTTPPWLAIRTPAAPPAQELLLPSGIVAETIPRKQYDGDTRVATSGTLWLASIILPGGEPITKINSYVSSDATTQTSAFACIVDPADGAVLAVSADKGGTEPGEGPDQFTLSEEYEVEEDTPLYLGICYVAGTGPTLRSFNSSASFWATDVTPDTAGGEVCAGATALTGLTEPVAVDDDVGTITPVAECLYLTVQV